MCLIVRLRRSFFIFQFIVTIIFILVVLCSDMLLCLSLCTLYVLYIMCVHKCHYIILYLRHAPIDDGTPDLITALFDLSKLFI